MPDKSLYEKLLDNLPLVLILIGALVFVAAASGGFTLGSAALQIANPAWQMALGILGSALIAIGLAIYVYERLGKRQSAQVKTFKDLLACLKYVNQQLQAAQLQIDDLSWSDEVGKSDDLAPIIEESRNYHALVKQKANRLAYREVFVLNRKDREEKLFAMLSNNASGYSCGFYPTGSSNPLLQFMLIDKKEVIFLHGDYPYVACQQPELVELFSRYYEDIWQRSTRLKYGQDFDWNAIEAALGSSQASALRKMLKA